MPVSIDGDADALAGRRGRCSTGTAYWIDCVVAGGEAVADRLRAWSRRSSETARTSGREASSRAPAAGSSAATALMMCRSRVTLPPSSRTSGAAAARRRARVELDDHLDALVRRARGEVGERGAQRRPRRGGDRRVARGGSSAREPVSATGSAAIASRAMPIIQRIRKTMFGASRALTRRPPCRGFRLGVRSRAGGWAASIREAPGFASPPRGGFALRTAALARSIVRIPERREGSWTAVRSAPGPRCSRSTAAGDR